MFDQSRRPTATLARPRPRATASLWLLCLLTIGQGILYLTLLVLLIDRGEILFGGQIPGLDSIALGETVPRVAEGSYLLMAGGGLTLLTLGLLRGSFQAWVATLILESIILATDLYGYFVVGARSVFPLYITMALAAAAVLLLNQRDLLARFQPMVLPAGDDELT